VNCVFSVQSPVFLGALDAEKSALLDRPGGGSAAEWDRYAASKGRHFWQTDLRFYGPAKVIATGGLAEVIAPVTDVIEVVDLHLTLKGLKLIYDLNA